MRLRPVTCAFASLALVALACTPLACGGDDDGHPTPTPDAGLGDAASDASRQDATADAGTRDGASTDSSTVDADAGDTGATDAGASDGPTHDAAADSAAQDAATDSAVDAGPSHFRWKKFVSRSTSEIAPDRYNRHGIVVEGDGVRFYGDTVGAVKFPVSVLVTQHSFDAIPLIGNAPFDGLAACSHNDDRTFSSMLYLPWTAGPHAAYSIATWAADGSAVGVVPLPNPPGLDQMYNAFDGRGTMFATSRAATGNTFEAYDAAGTRLFSHPLADGYPAQLVRADDGTLITLSTAVEPAPIVVAGWSPDGTNLWSKTFAAYYGSSARLVTGGAFVGVERNVSSGNPMFAVVSLADGTIVRDFVPPDSILALTSDGGFYGFDSTKGLVKHDAAGSLVWSEHVSATQETTVKSDPQGNAYFFAAIDVSSSSFTYAKDGVFVGAIGD